MGCSCETPLLSALAVFKNTLNQEVIRSVHIYRFEDGKERGIEREFMFWTCSSYEEMVTHPILRLSRLGISKLVRGRVIGPWLCILAFDANNNPPMSNSIPCILLLSRNPKLKSIPTLTEDLQRVYHLRYRTDNKETETSQLGSTGMVEVAANRSHHSIRVLPVLKQDLNCLPYPVVESTQLEDEQSEQTVADGILQKKKKRAATEHIARIALSDIAKYFGQPITEASRNLKVGLTVLKRKCRELGIPRWPHRKIKSLDTLIYNLQEEAKRQERENKAAAAMAVLKRQRMLEREKEGIERKPFTEIKSETKRFRQDVFKRRHRARAALKNYHNQIS